MTLVGLLQALKENNQISEQDMIEVVEYFVDTSNSTDTIDKMYKKIKSAKEAEDAIEKAHQILLQGRIINDA